MLKGHFNIRVYGLLINAFQEVLLSDEFQDNVKFTKFPGGGLEFGESTIECLERECLEEMNQKIKVVSHFYTTDRFVTSIFSRDKQLLSIYYLIDLDGDQTFKTTQNRFDFVVENGKAQSFRFQKIAEIDPQDLVFPMDRLVLEMLKQRSV